MEKIDMDYSDKFEKSLGFCSFKKSKFANVC